MRPEALEHPINILAEGPVWRTEEVALYWTDIMDHTLWRWTQGARAAEQLRTPFLLVGGFCFDEAGAMLLCTNRGVWRWPAPFAQPFGSHAVLSVELPLKADERCNDITVDPTGRLYIGTLRDTLTGGTLYKWRPGEEEPVPIIRDTRCANGMTLTLDEQFLFFTDSLTRTIRRFKWDRATGSISDPEDFFVLDAAHGVPDGITLDADGRMWVAACGGNRVLVVDSDGRVEREVMMPAKQVTSVQFGGPELTDLFVTSSCEGAVDRSTGRDEHGAFLGGTVYRIPNAGRGRAEWVASVA